MKTVSLDKLVGMSRLYADQRPASGTPFVPNTDGGTGTVGSLHDLINSELAELYDLFVSAAGDEYYRQSTDITTTAGTTFYNCPADFYRLLALHVIWDSQNWEPIRKLGDLRHIGRYQWQQFWARGSAKAYRLTGQQIPTGNLERIEFTPATPAGLTIRVHYIPAFTPLTSGAHTFNGVNGWDDLVALNVACKLRAIEQQPFNDLMLLSREKRERIEKLARDRDNEPGKIIDLDVDNSSLDWLRSHNPPYVP